LLGAASRGETITYGTLMRKFDLSRGKALSRMISAVDRKEHASGAPGFAAIIVRKDTRCPGGGYFCDDTLPPRLRRPGSRASDPRLSEAERSHIKRRQREIWAYYAEANSSTRRRNRLPRAGRLRVGRSGV
jgi:hypothetical protein